MTSNSSEIEYIPTSRTSGRVFEVEDVLAQFVGAEYVYDEGKNGKIAIHYPKTLGKLPLDDEKANRKLLLNLFKSLKLTKNADGEDRDYGEASRDINLDKFPLYSFLWVLDDFKAHGRMLFSETVNSKDPSGKIDWKKTFQGSSVIYNGSIVYNDYVYRKKVRSEALLTEIYDYCVYRSLNMLFFLTSLPQNLVHPLYKDIKGRRNEYRNCLKEALETTFDDERKLRYRHMLNIVEKDSYDSLSSKNLIGVPSYDHVFEKEIDSLLGNVPDISEYYPEARIQIDGEKESRHLSNLREDTIHIENDECFIFDSKFYEFGNMPKAESVEKQIVYGENIELNHRFASNKIFNIFLIPRSFKDEGWETKDVIKYHGYSFSRWKPGVKNYEFVLIYFIDLSFVLDNYKSGQSQKLFDRIREDVMKRM